MKLFPLLFALLAAGPAAGSAPVVQLPTYVVTDTRVLPAPESWRYAAVPGFEFLSEVSAGETRARVRDFILFHRAVEVVWPLVRIDSQAPAAVIFCAGPERFAPFAPPNAPKDLSGTISLTVQNHEQAAIIVNLAAAAAGGGDGASMDDYETRLLRGEYVHFLFSRLEPAPPAWLAHGLTRLFLKMDYGEGKIRFGSFADGTDFAARQALAAHLKAAPARPLNSWTSDPDFQKGVEHGALLPLNALFNAPPPGSADLDDAGTAWARGCLEFVHWGLFSAGGRYRKGLVMLALAARDQPVTEALFEKCFAISYADMQVLLWADTDFAGGVSLKFPPPPDDPSHFELRAATDAEVGRIKGDALRLGGRLDTAHLNLIAPYLRGSRDPELLAALGQEEASAGHDERARRFLEAAVAAKTHRARAYAELARLDLALVPARGSQLTAAQWQPILNLLMAGHALRPPLRATYELLAGGWLRAAPKPTLDELGTVVEGVRQFPDDFDLIAQAAALCAASGYRGAGATLAEFGLGHAVTAADRARFERLHAAFAGPPG